MAITSPRASQIGYSVPPVFNSNQEEHRRQLADAVYNLFLGKLNNTGTVTLTENAASTTLSDARIGYTTKVFLIPTTANAASAVGTTYQTYPNTTEGRAVINHANNAQTDRTFAYALLG